MENHNSKKAIKIAAAVAIVLLALIIGVTAGLLWGRAIAGPKAEPAPPSEPASVEPAPEPASAPEPPEILTASGMVFGLSDTELLLLQSDGNFAHFPASILEGYSVETADTVTIRYTQDGDEITVISVEVEPYISAFLIDPETGSFVQDPETGLIMPNPESPDYGPLMENFQEQKEQILRQQEEERQRQEAERLRQEEERRRQEEEERLRQEEEERRRQEEEDAWDDDEDDDQGDRYDDNYKSRPQINWFGN